MLQSPQGQSCTLQAGAAVSLLRTRHELHIPLACHLNSERLQIVGLVRCGLWIYVTLL
jgi:hypothetical protein